MKYRGPKEPFPFQSHRSLGEIREAYQRGQRNSMVRQFGEPGLREAKAAELRGRKLALPGLTNKLIAELAGIDPAGLSHILALGKRGSWFTLGLIEGAIAREEARREASKGRGCKSQINPLPEERARSVVGGKGAAPRLAAGGAA